MVGVYGSMTKIQRDTSAIIVTQLWLKKSREHTKSRRERVLSNFNRATQIWIHPN